MLAGIRGMPNNLERVSAPHNADVHKPVPSVKDIESTNVNGTYLSP